MYMNFDTGEIWTLEEVKKMYEDFQSEMEYDSFEEFLDTMLEMGREKTGGLIEIGQGVTAKEIINNGYYDAAVNLMDDEIREELHREIAPCTDEEFLIAYMARHEEKYGIGFEI